MSTEVKSPPPTPPPEGEGSSNPPPRGEGGRRASAGRVGSRPVQTRERLYLYDTTLRDGQQTPGVDFSL